MQMILLKENKKNLILSKDCGLKQSGLDELESLLSTCADDKKIGLFHQQDEFIKQYKNIIRGYKNKDVDAIFKELIKVDSSIGDLNQFKDSTKELYEKIHQILLKSLGNQYDEYLYESIDKGSKKKFVSSVGNRA